MGTRPTKLEEKEINILYYIITDRIHKEENHIMYVQTLTTIKDFFGKINHSKKTLLKYSKS